MRLRTIGATAVLLTGLTTAAFAGSETPAATPRLDAMFSNALFQTSNDATLGSTAPVESMISNALAQAAGLSGSEDHQFAVGVRLGGYGFGFGGGIRYFFGGPFGVQVEVHRYGGISFTEFEGAVLYRFKDIKMDFPIILTPYIGGGVSFARYFGVSDTGGFGLGGVEVFFEQLPKAGVSVQFAFRPSISGYAFGGANGTIGFYWYLA